ncbi:MAG TPA: hypothetical protein VIL69_00810 [Roseomonas sp.]|jgi:hypothetical protein
MMFHEDHAAQVFYQPGTADYLVITFSELMMQADGRRFWGGEPLQRLGVPALGFVAKRKRWFSDEFMRRSLEASLPKLEGHGHRITYGFSMGAYGAIRHAARLGARTAIACSPQWTIDPAQLVGQHQPFAEHFREDKHKGMELNSFPADGRLYLFHDPHDRHDAWHAARIREHIAQTVLIGMPFVGHGSVRPFSSTPLVAALIEAARSHDDELVRRVARHARRANPSRPFLLASHLRTGQFDRGAALLRRAPSKGAAHTQALVWLQYAQQAQAKGRAIEACEMAERAILLAQGQGRVSAMAAEIRSVLQGM